jgi:hypothetical protein
VLGIFSGAHCRVVRAVTKPKAEWHINNMSVTINHHEQDRPNHTPSLHSPKAFSLGQTTIENSIILKLSIGFSPTLKLETVN